MAHIGKSTFQYCNSLASSTSTSSTSTSSPHALSTNTRSYSTSTSSSFTSSTSTSSTSTSSTSTYSTSTSSFLLSISLGEFVTHIGEGAFGDCTFLASVRFGAFVAHMGKVPFTIDSLEGISLGEFVTHTGDGGRPQVRLCPWEFLQGVTLPWSLVQQHFKALLLCPSFVELLCCLQIYRLTLPLCYLSQWEIYIQEVILIHMVWWHISTTLLQDYVINLVNLLQLTLQHHLLPLEE